MVGLSNQKVDGILMIKNKNTLATILQARNRLQLRSNLVNKPVMKTFRSKLL
jgi:hypothetical protein